MGVGAGGISCQMCNKIKSSWWPDTSIQECLKGYQTGVLWKVSSLCGKYINRPQNTTQSLAKTLQYFHISGC